MTRFVLLPCLLLPLACAPEAMWIGAERASGVEAGGAGGTDNSAGSGPGGAPETGPLDGVIAAMPEGSWKALPGTSMDAVCPPTGNAYPCKSVVAAWSGGAFDTLQDRLIVFGGGYSDSYYNNVFTFDLNTGQWKRWTELPAGLQGGVDPIQFTDKRVEACGLYPSVAALDIPAEWLTATGYLLPEKCDDPTIAAQLDPQQPRSAHSFGNIAFSHATGHFYSLGLAFPFPTGQGSSPRVMSFDFSTGLWSRLANHPQLGTGASATDAEGHLWYLGRDAGNLLEFDPVKDVWKIHDAPARRYYYAGADVDRKRSRMVLTQDTEGLTVYDLKQPALPPQEIGNSTQKQAPGFVYVDHLDRFVAWSGGKTVRWLNPESWTWTAQEGSGDDPGAGAKNGTFGRLRYSPKRKVLVLVNAASSDVMLFKLPSSAP